MRCPAFFKPIIAMLKSICRLALWLAVFLILGSVTITVAGLWDDIEPSDIGVVLGSQVLVRGHPSPRLQARLDKAVELYQQGVLPRILVSGGIERNGISEAQVMANYLISQGIPREAILLDEHGNTTQATALNTAQIMRDAKLESAMIVTEYFHIPRARLAFDKAGISVIHNAHADFISWRSVFYSTPREVVAFPVYWLREFPEDRSE
ncbi:MAG: YdcF family protein [Methylobacillus sp.]|nr:YdcF family protein [Methylobacillus sp.]